MFDDDDDGDYDDDNDGDDDDDGHDCDDGHDYDDGHDDVRFGGLEGISNFVTYDHKNGDEDNESLMV